MYKTKNRKNTPKKRKQKMSEMRRTEEWDDNDAADFNQSHKPSTYVREQYGPKRQHQGRVFSHHGQIKSNHRASVSRPRIDYAKVSLDLVPLAQPKGQFIGCDLCGAAAHFMCKQCRNAFYCTQQHLEMDYELMHPSVCSTLKELRGPLPFSNYESERVRYKAQRRLDTKKIVKISFEKARTSLSSRRPREAILQGNYCLRFAKNLYNKGDTNMIPFFLVFAEAYAADDKLDTSLEYLAKAEYIVLKHSRCPAIIKADLYKTKGMTNVYANNLDKAIVDFSNEIIYATEAFHTEHLRTGIGYFHLGTVFLQMEETITAHSLFLHAVDIMKDTLDEDFHYLVKLDGQENLLGSHDPDAKKGNLSEEDLGEIRNQIFFIYDQFTTSSSSSSSSPSSSFFSEQNIDKGSQKTGDIGLVKVCYVLAVYNYVIGQYKQGLEFVHKAHGASPSLLGLERQDNSRHDTPVTIQILPKEQKQQQQQKDQQQQQKQKQQEQQFSAASPIPASEPNPASSIMVEKLKFVKKHLKRQLSKKAKEMV